MDGLRPHGFSGIVAVKGVRMNASRISMLQIEYFLAVAQHLNFSEAARSLYITQPAISRKVAQFEQEVGVQLFVRTKRSVRLTPAGAVLLKELRPVAEHIDTALEKCRQPNLAEGASLSIGCLDAMNTDRLLRDALITFKRAHPGVNLILERHSFKALRDKLIGGGLDLIFTMSFEIDDSQGIVHDCVDRVGTCILMSADHPLATRDTLSLADLRDTDFVLISRDESPKGFDSVINQCRLHGFTPHIVKHLPNVESLLLCVESGLGVSLFDTSIRLHNDARFKKFALQNDAIEIVMAWRRENLNPAIPLFANRMLPGVAE